MNDGAEPAKPAAAGRGKARNWMILVALLAGMGCCLYLLRGEAAAGRHLIRFGLRAGVVALALVGWFRSQAMIGSRGLSAGAITDGAHEITAGLHRHFQTHRKHANVLLIVSSGFIDLFGLYLIAATLFGPTMRPFVALLVLFLMRQICQSVCALPAPRDMIWRYPGFPSLLVTYGTSNDFFFSGHTAIAVLGAIEIAHTLPLWMGVAAAVVACLEALVVLTLRAHYSMDIFGAVVAAFFAFGIAGWVCGAV